MIITLNYEAPNQGTVVLTGTLSVLFATESARTRVQDSSYTTPDGLRVHVKTVVSKINTPLGLEAAHEAVYALACQLDQDCIAVRFESRPGAAVRDTLIGPRAERRLPFNPAYFVEY